MKNSFKLARVALCLSTLGLSTLGLSLPAWCQQIDLAPVKTSGVYAPGEKIVWDVKVSGAGAETVKTANYKIRKGGGDVLSEGTVDLSTGSGQVETIQTAPMAYQADLTTKGADGKEIRSFGGAVVSPELIEPSLPRPVDFDEFWAAKIAQLEAIPATPTLTVEPSERAGVEYSKISFDNIGGSKIRGQIARPTVGEKFPAVLVLQWAGVYGLPKGNVTGRAADGWLALNISAHDLPLDESADFYKKASETTLKNYATQGNDSRETSYMLKMLLGCVRAAKYLASRPDWNGQTFVATGSSQGGYQSLAVAGLVQQITAVTVNVPAGCDMAGMVAGRRTPWPYWTGQNVTDANRAAVIEASRYFDPVNFAPHIKAPVLVGVGLVDNTSTPAGVFSMVNRLGGPKEVVVLPLADHQGKNNSHAAYNGRSSEWMKALKQNQAPPIAPQSLTP